jgi:voltage-gated potassium channel Kch
LTFSYNLVLALFLLAPGFAAFAGLFFSSRREPSLHPAPPAPTSVLTLALVTLAALCLHGAWATALAAQDLWSQHHWHVAVPFQPNIYVALLEAGEKAQAAGGTQSPIATPIGGGDIAAILVTLIAQSLFGFRVTIAIVSSRKAEALLRPYLYGWAAEILPETPEEGIVNLITAFVVTRMDGTDIAFGYEGSVETLTLGADKEILSIFLTQVTAFYIELEAGKFKRRVLPQTSGIPNLYLSKEEIRNVSFTVLRLPADLDTSPSTPPNKPLAASIGTKAPPAAADGAPAAKDRRSQPTL